MECISCEGRGWYRGEGRGYTAARGEKMVCGIGYTAVRGEKEV
jgi:hypothetical protein